MKKVIQKFIFEKLLGWKIVGSFHPKTKKYVLIGAPHTSWKDLFISMLARSYSEITINFIAKKSLFKPPFGFILRYLGGTPVDRSKSTNLVGAIIQIFKEKEKFRLAISPEGTRERVEKWKTGFYYIAKGANVPIVMFGFDFENKEIRLSDPFYPTDDIKADFDFFLEFYKDIKGAKPKLFNNDKII